ncbi:MAG: hypothetical protein CR972_03550 [Candidatus Moraniibacteriota bacterium]|nr:MAG: hypothetical protein CR972_03550 [Candidatus Moranbacteria bacterium]
MKIRIIYSQERIAKELPFIQKHINHFIQNEMFFYFPFDAHTTLRGDDVRRQICSDEEKYQIKNTQKTLTTAWHKKERDVFYALQQYNTHHHTLTLCNDYNCFLTFYGCYGYYNAPHEIFININAPIEDMLMTIVHELLHLCIYVKTAQMSYQETEQAVDDLFFKANLHKIFPHYTAQKI